MIEDLRARIDRIVEQDPRYRAEAYFFVLTALEETLQALGERRHLTGQELCEGIRRLAVREFGLMARTVLEFWGCQTTRDFGNIVYNLIDAGLMSKTEQDRIEDFDDVYDFGQAFAQDFGPDNLTETTERT